MEDIKRCLVCDERKVGCNLTCKKHYLAYKEKYLKNMRKYKATEERKISCNDCIHYGICTFHLTSEEYKKCFHFKPKSRFIELPCAVGDTVYVLRSKTSNGKNLYLREERISHYRVFGERTFMCFDSERISVADYEWINVFLTKEEAEKALERSEGK